MSERYPLLAAMRARRQQIEDEIAAPYKAAADRALAVASAERQARQGLERIMQSKFVPQLLNVLSRKIADYAHRGIIEAVMKQRSATSVTTLEVPTAMLEAASPSTTVSRVVDWWKRESASKASFYVPADAMSPVADMSYTAIEVRIPEMRYRERVANDF